MSASEPETSLTPPPAGARLPIDAAAHPRRLAGARLFPLGEREALLYVEGREMVHTLNLSAWAVWDLCDGSRSVAEIAVELAGDLGLPPAALTPDIVASVERLAALDLLESA